MDSDNIPRTLSRILSQLNGSKTREKERERERGIKVEKERERERMPSVRIYKAVTWFVGNDRAMRHASSVSAHWPAHRSRARASANDVRRRCVAGAHHWPGAVSRRVRVRCRAIWRARTSPSTLGHLRPMIAERALLFSGTQGTSLDGFSISEEGGDRWARVR